MALSRHHVPAQPRHSSRSSAECVRGGGCHLLLSDEMEGKKLIRKPLQPARPIRRCVPDDGSLIMVNLQTEITDCCKDNMQDYFSLWCSIHNLYDTLKDPAVPTQLEKPQMQTRKGRITYTRDFLIQLSRTSVSRQKPKYLPDHPVVLQRPLSDLSETVPLSSSSSIV